MDEKTFASIDWKTLEATDKEKYQDLLDDCNFKQRQLVAAKLKGGGLGTKVDAVVVDPNSARYEEMARPDDPGFAVFKRNYTGNADDGNFWFWFGTFWKEMPKADRLNVVKKLVTPDGELQGSWTYLDVKTAAALPQAKHKEIKTFLKEDMLKKGLTAWNKKATAPTEGTKILPKIEALGKQEYGVGFRGDARDYATLMLHDQGAFKPKIKSPFAINKYNLDKPWNPFSDDDVKNTMYWREGQADNDLFTVVSVAKDFGTSTKFPLLDDPGPDLQIYPNRAQLQIADRTSKVESVKMVTVSKMYVYMVVANEGYDTQSYQSNTSSFPEIGVGYVEAEKFLARMEVLRLHYGTKGDDGHVVYVMDYTIHHQNNHKLLYQKNDDTGVVSKFIDYMTTTYYRHFFQYNTVTSPKLLKVVSCDLIPETYINIYNRELQHQANVKTQ